MDSIKHRTVVLILLHALKKIFIFSVTYTFSFASGQSRILDSRVSQSRNAPCLDSVTQKTKLTQPISI